jgi:protein TonB
MLNQLIESKNQREETKKRGGFLLATFFVVTTMLLSGVLWSLFAKDLSMRTGDLELSAIVTPVPETNNEPEPPQRQETRTEPQKLKTDLPTRQTNIARINEMQPAPDTVSVAPNTQKSRPNTPFRISDEIETDVSYSSSATAERGTGNSQGDGLGKTAEANESKVIEKTVAPPPPPPAAKKPVETARKSNAPISSGVVNGKAVNLPKPVYPAAIAVRAGGNVDVQVTIDEAGNVTSAKAVSGHPLLRDVAERAARGAKFKPTMLSNQPVKVSGIIVYNFARN